MQHINRVDSPLYFNNLNIELRKMSLGAIEQLDSWLSQLLTADSPQPPSAA